MKPPSVNACLPANHLARFVVEVIEHLDLSALTRQYGGRGSAARHPAVLLGLLMDGYASGDCSQANVQACSDAGIAPLLAIKRESQPQTSDPTARMVQLGTQARRTLYTLRKQTVERVFGIIQRVTGWRQMSMRGLYKAQGEWNLVTIRNGRRRQWPWPGRRNSGCHRRQ